MIHDFGDGVYYSDSADVAREYAAMRAERNVASAQVLRGNVPRGSLGRLLDLTRDPRWAEFVRRPLGRHTAEALIRQANTNYWPFFENFLRQNRLRLEDYDAIIGPEYVRGGTQICVRSAAAQARMRAAMQVWETGARRPEPTPSCQRPEPRWPPAVPVAAHGRPAAADPPRYPPGRPRAQGRVAARRCPRRCPRRVRPRRAEPGRRRGGR